MIPCVSWSDMNDLKNRIETVARAAYCVDRVIMAPIFKNCVYELVFK